VPEEVQGKEVTEFEFKMLEEEVENGVALAKVIPNLFRNLRFKVKVNADPLAGKTDAVKKALGLQAYDRAIQNQFGNQESLLRDFVLEPVKPGESDKYIQIPQAAAQAPSAGQPDKALVSQLTQQGKLGTAQLAGQNL
ncbi:MAG: hypothetical protein IH891_01285, partial [Planctomycetes bacterium]|nr:hypothetical protein [Planctomycetota bacterium]